MADIDLDSNAVEGYSDDQLAAYIGDMREQIFIDQQQYPRLIDIAATSVSKAYGSKEELEDASLAIDQALEIGVRAPRIKRIVQQDDIYECIYERIYGSSLMECWADLGWLTTVRLGFQLRTMVRQMRRQVSPTAGSLGTGIARTFWLDDAFGMPSRMSSLTITSLVNFWYNMGTFRQESRKSKEEHSSSCSGPVKPQRLVLTHHDLAPRNLMVDQAGDLWLVDWDYAGWYPPYFEHAGMHRFYRPENWGWMAKFRWKVFTWLATGLFAKERRILNEAQRKCIRFRAGRRFNIKAGVTPSTRSVDD
ncbi:hypothetical protein F5Y18DRAFT_429831 [Xylariaceae sp. FL1019]|nr:hypothetical protein F5Y18DRAFT_429831 [Xylariaceae sp. FL1019]